MQFLLENKDVILVFLISLSEVLALIPGIKSNSIFQLVVNSGKSLIGKKE